MTRAFLLDIEGTTTPIAFVHETLFPFARARAGAFLREHAQSPAIVEVERRLTDEHAADVAAGQQPAALGEPYVHWLMDRDRKSPGLKLLQGLIWEQGYRDGRLKGDVYADVVPAIRRWRDAGCRVAIYSSGSVLAQRLLFSTTPYGDVTPLIDAFFDTAVGAKIASDSYRAIARSLNAAPAEITFISDVTAELAAARQAGMAVILSRRPGNPPQPQADAFPAIDSFAEVAAA